MIAALALLVPGGVASASPSPGVSQAAQETSPYSTGIVPNVVGQDLANAVAAVRAAGFVARSAPGYVDCGPPYVQSQTPAGGSAAVSGSTVTLRVNRQPSPGQHCP
ncbi:PASTA domain-containing protein [Actinosynnema sp. NPDC050436]|uniref:PASTA domain-containing protein n=1 Tax=Actinosynnema sp. NPDC050436 TaxID=3155659 RepID=UPI0033FDD54B